MRLPALVTTAGLLTGLLPNLASAAETGKGEPEVQALDTLATVCPGFVEPKVTRKVVAKFPRDHRTPSFFGFVLLDVTVDSKGHVVSTSVVNSPGPQFSREAERAAMKWKYEPALCNGKAVPVRRPLTFVFRK